MATARDTPSASRPYGWRLFVAYLALAVVVAAGIAVIQCFPKNSEIQKYGPNVVADFFGILVTLVLVDRLLAWQRDRNAAPLRAIALQRVSHYMNRLVFMLLYAYKAAAAPGSPTPDTFDELLTAWEREAQFLDFRKSAGPEQSERSWHQFAAETMEDFESNVHDVIDRYLSVLGVDFTAAAESLIGDIQFSVLKSGPLLEQIDRARGYDIPRQSFAIVDLEGNGNSAKDFAQRVRALHAAYLRIGGPPLGLGVGLYNGGPAWGSGRYVSSVEGSPSVSDSHPSAPPADS